MDDFDDDDGGLGLPDDDLTGGNDIAATITFAAPAAGFVRVTGSASIDAGAPDSFITASVLQDGVSRQAIFWDAGDDDGNLDLRQNIESVSAVSAGSHTFTLRLNDALSANFSSFSQAQVIVEFFPTGSAPIEPEVRPSQP